jgi:biotin transport system substrate-specific component
LQARATLTLADAFVPVHPDASRAAAWARDLVLMAGFALLVALSAQFVVRVPWTTVPITGQTFAVLVGGGALGARRGAGSMVMYMLLGMVAPAYAPGSAGLTGSWGAHVLLPWKGTQAMPWEISSGGYIVGFIAAAALVGWLAERGWDRKAWSHLAMLLGNLAIYAFGLAWLGYLIASGWTPPGAAKPLADLIAGSSTVDKTLNGGLYPFIVGDLMKIQLAATALPVAWLVARRR